MIRLGTTTLADYTKISVLGKGTYGEVHKCVHNPTSQVVAMKTFLFEVSHYNSHQERALDCNLICFNPVECD